MKLEDVVTIEATMDLTKIGGGITRSREKLLVAEIIGIVTKSITDLEALLPVYIDGMDLIKEGSQEPLIKALSEKFDIFGNDDEIKELAQDIHKSVVKFVEAMNRWSGAKTRVTIVRGL